MQGNLRSEIYKYILGGTLSMFRKIPRKIEKHSW